MATNVGSVSVSVIPTMSGFANKVASEFGASGAQAGNSFTKGLNSTTSATSGVSAKLGAIAGAAAAVAQTGITAAMNAISSSISGAVSRVDTLNNFPKVLQGLGYSAEEASAAVNKMSEHITGLPTTLDSITSSVQQILPSVGDVDDATNIMLAFNDALVAGGASTQVQEAALTQFTQVLAKGKPELEDWRSIQTAMPGQLDQVAKSMLGASADSNSLYEALKAGTVTVDDFTSALVSLDSVGYDGFASFAEQAKAGTAGIATSFTNMQTAMVRALGNVIDEINSNGEITSIFSDISKVISSVGNVVAGAIPNIKSFISAFAQSEGVQSLAALFSSISQKITEIGTSAGVFLPQMQTMFISLVNSGVAYLMAVLPHLSEVFQNLASAILPLLMSVFQTLTPIISNIATQVFPLLVSAATSLVNMFSSLVSALTPIVSALLPYFQVIITTIINVLSGLLVVLEGVCTYLTGVFSGDWQKAWSGIKQIFQGIIQVIASIAQGYLSKMQALFQSALTIMSQAWQNTWNSVMSYFSNILAGIISTAQSSISTVLNEFFSLKDNIINFFSNADSWLYNSGRAILEGLGQGIQSAISSVVSIAEGAVSTIRDLFPFSPAKKGPFSGHGYTTYSGRALMSDFAKGAVSVAPFAQRTISKALSSITDTPTLGINARTNVSALTSNIKASDYASARGNNSNVIINLEGATLNDDSQMQSVALEFMQELLRVNKMRKAGA